MTKQVKAIKPTKSESITLRVTQELKAQLDAEAKRQNVPRGEIVRQKLSK
jgi:predicted HicB family RNase H-like nuclease